MPKPYIVVSFRCSHDEKRILKDKASKLGLCLGAYLRAHAYVAQHLDPVMNALPTTHQTDNEDIHHATQQESETTTQDMAH